MNDRKVKRLGAVAPVKLEGTAGRLSREELMEATRYLDGYASGYAAASAYYNAVALGGSHEDGVKAFNRVRKAVRKALGYITTPTLSF